MKASEIKRGMVVQIDTQSVVIKEVQVQTASSRSGNTLYKIRGRDVASKQKIEKSFKGEEILQTVDFERRPIQFLFQDPDGVTFMDQETYEQYALAHTSVEEEALYLVDNLEGIHALVVDGRILGIELPSTVVMNVITTAPSLKGASASARTKPATLTTGLVVQVPEYISPGEIVKINTETGLFMSRA